MGKQTISSKKTGSAMLQNWFEQINSAILFVKDGIIIDCNPAMAQRMDCARETLIGQTWQEVRRSHAKPLSLAEETALNGSTGELVVTCPIYHPAQSNLPSEQVAQILEASQDLIAIADPEGRLIYLNPTGRNLLRIAPDDALDGLTLASAHPAWAAEWLMEKGLPAARAEGRWAGETSILSLTGEEIAMMETLIAHYDSAGQVRSVTSIARDISAEKKLAQQQYETLVERGYQVLLGTEIAQDIASAPQIEQLFERVVTLVKERFGYYHAQLLRYDAEQEVMHLVTGYGEIGAAMLAQGYQVKFGSGLIGLAAETGQTILRPDVSQDPYWQPHPMLPETRGEIVVPIRFGERLLGVLDVQSQETGALLDDDRLMLEGLCGQIAIAIDGALLRHELEEQLVETRRAEEIIAKRASELAKVSEIATLAATILIPDEMLQTVADLTQSSFDLYHVHIYLLNETGDMLILARGSGEVGRRMVSEVRMIGLDAEQSLVARAARARAGVVVNDVQSDIAFLPHPLLPSTRSELAAPLIAGGALLGVLDVQSDRTNRFSAEDVNILTTLAAQVAASLQNARSYARAQRQADRETMINAISERIQSATTIEETLQIAVGELGRALGAQRALIQLQAPTIGRDEPHD